ncbi:MAG: large subunit ribosomal protein L22 [Parcubacteria group bacterium LiPW_72]|nr:MAG: large subunit ribosomal protein L22 [Parcubacteria group bacterium LiPW_72]
MEAKAKLRHLHIAPRKVRLVINLIRGLEVGRALDQLSVIKQRAARPVFKLLKSAIANAEHNFNLDKNNLYIKEIRADEGPSLKRWQPRAFGRAHPIIKRASHVSLILEERVAGRRKTKSGGEALASPQKTEKSALKVGKNRVIPTPEIPQGREVPLKPWDPRREAGRRNKQHQDKKKLAQGKTLSGLKRFFQRKSV